MPIGFALATGFTAVFVGTVAAAVAPRHHPVLRVAVLAAFVAAGAAVTASLAGAVGTATMGWPSVNGFLVNGLGDLVWRGVADLIRLAVSLAAALAGPAAGRGWQHRRAGRHEAWTDPAGYEVDEAEATVTRLLPGQQPRSPRASGWRPTNAQKGEGMADLIFVALTIAVFVVLGLVLKAVERL